jgi:hypothetical protein
MVAPMTALLDPRTADKLARICGMFGSDHDGERAAAAQMADKLVKQQGLRWADVISITPCSMAPPRPSTVAKSDYERSIRSALRDGAGVLNDWELGFLSSLLERKRLTQKQINKLRDIGFKVEVSRRAA